MAALCGLHLSCVLSLVQCWVTSSPIPLSVCRLIPAVVTLNLCNLLPLSLLSRQESRSPPARTGLAVHMTRKAGDDLKDKGGRRGTGCMQTRASLELLLQVTEDGGCFCVLGVPDSVLPVSTSQWGNLQVPCALSEILCFFLTASKSLWSPW